MPKTIKPIRIEGDLAYVPLTKGYEAIVDATDVPLVEGYNWTAAVKSRTVYAIRTDYTGPKQRRVRMHRVILGEPEGMQVDHRDGNGLNNRRDNLRKATHSQNTHNARTSNRNTSGFKGVGWNKAKAKWQARICINGKRKSLGYHDTPEVAYAAYCKASAKLHGEFGRTK